MTKGAQEMIRTAAVVSVAAFAIAAAVEFPGLGRVETPLPIRSHAAPAPVATTAPGDAAKRISRREQMARLVAETAAATADHTAHRVLAEKSGAQQTALR